MLDSLIIGGGPAGLTAAIYLGRFRRSFRIVDAEHSRAAWIPSSHNHSGFPDGINGRDLLARMREQACRYGAKIIAAEVQGLAKHGGEAFSLQLSNGDELVSRTIIFATGVIDIEPELPNLFNAVQRGLIRHCPICDGYEVIGQRIGVICPAEERFSEALFLRTYSSDVTILGLCGPLRMTDAERKSLQNAGIQIVEEKVERVIATETCITKLVLHDGRELAFDTIYSALGTIPRSDLARSLGVKLAEDGRIIVDLHQMTSVDGLYAIGDVVQGLNQISVAMGHAAIAAAAIHNRLDPDWL